MDHIRNEDFRKEAHIKPVETFLENKIPWWFDHCVRRERKHIPIRAKSPRLEVSGRRGRGRPKTRQRNNKKKSMKKYQLTEDMAQDRKYRTAKIMVGATQGDGQERSGVSRIFVWGVGATPPCIMHADV